MKNTTILNQIAHLKRFALLTFYAESVGIRFLVTEFIRTKEQQQERYLQGRTKPGKIVTNIDGVTKISKHQTKEAHDILIIDDNGNPVWEHTPEYTKLGEMWEQLGGVWGGRWYIDGKTKFDDCYHFQS